MVAAADIAAGRGRAAFRVRRADVIQYGLAGLTIVIVLGPILPILYQSVIDRPLYDTGAVLTIANYVDLVTGPAFTRIATNTVVFALLATLIGVAIGTSTALLVGRTDLPLRRAIGGLLLWPIFVSQLVLAVGWFMVYGPAGYLTLMVQSLTGVRPWNLYTLAGMAIVAGVAQAPLTFLYCIASTALSEATLEDAARTCGAGPFRTLSSVTLPLLRPAILYSTILTFTSALEMLAIPLVFGGAARIELFTTFLYHQGYASPRPDYGIVATAAVILLVVIIVLLTAQRRLLRNAGRFVTVGGKASRSRVLSLGRFRWPIFGVMAFYIAFFVLAPLLILFLRASVSILSPLIPFWDYFTAANFVRVFVQPSNLRSITNTILVSVVGAGVGMFFVAMITVIVHRSQFRFRTQLEYIALFPRAVPGLVAGMGFFYAMIIVPPIGWLRATIWILMVAYIMRYIPLAYGALSPALLQIGPELDRSARVMGADWWTAIRAVILKLMRPAMFSAYALLFIYFFKEYTAAVFLFTPGNEVIGSLLLHAWSNGDMGLVSALSSVQVVITMAFIVIVHRFIGIRIYS